MDFSKEKINYFIPLISACISIHWDDDFFACVYCFRALVQSSVFITSCRGLTPASN